MTNDMRLTPRRSLVPPSADESAYCVGCHAPQMCRCCYRPFAVVLLQQLANDEDVSATAIAEETTPSTDVALIASRITDVRCDSTIAA